MAILSPSPPLPSSLSLTHTPPACVSLLPPPHTHTRCSSGRSLLLIHTASLYLNPLSRLCRHLPPGVRGAVECYILDTLCCCCFTHTQTDTHTRTDAQADIFCLIMTAEMRRSSSTIAVSVKWRIPDGAASRRVIVRACSASAPGLCSKTKSWIRVAGAVWVHSDMFSFFLVTKHFRFEQLSVKLPLSLCWGGGCVVSTRVDAFVCF